MLKPLFKCLLFVAILSILVISLNWDHVKQVIHKHDKIVQRNAKENMFTPTIRSTCVSADGIHEQPILAPEKPPEYHTTWYYAVEIVDLLIDHKKSITIAVASIVLGIFMSFW